MVAVGGVMQDLGGQPPQQEQPQAAGGGPDPEQAGKVNKVTGDGLFVAGRNARGQLGMGNQENVLRLTRSPFFTAARKAKKVFCGYDHAFVITATDDIYAFGRNSKGQLGVGNTQDHSFAQKVHLLCQKQVCLMAGGLEFSVAVTALDEVYAWGSGSSGQLGLGYTMAKEMTPQRVDAMCGMGAVQLACGRNHTLLLTTGSDRGEELWGWGDNARGQLGLPHTLLEPGPERIDPLCGKQIVQLACGYHSSMVLTKEGEVFVAGDNSRGQLGMGPGEETVRTPCMIEALRNKQVVSIACGKEHSMVLTREDDLWAFGSNEHGQCGFPRSASPDKEFWPRRVVSLGGKGVTSIVCGRSHSFVQTQGGATLAMGSNTHGEMAVGGINQGEEDEDEDGRGVLQPTRVPLLSEKGLSIASKGSSTYVGLFHERERGGLGDMKASLMRDFAKLLQSEEFADLTLQHGSGEVYHVHRAVLSARCPALYQHAMKSQLTLAAPPSPVGGFHANEQQQQPMATIASKDAPAAAFLAVLEFIYSGDTGLRSEEDMSVEATFDVMATARKFGLSRLQGLCEKRVEAGINCQSLPYVLRRATEEAFHFIKRQCLHFTLEHYAELMGSSRHALGLVLELKAHPQLLAQIMGMSIHYKNGDRTAPCIEELPATSDVLCEDCFPEDMARLFDKAVAPSVQEAGEDKEEEEEEEEEEVSHKRKEDHAVKVLRAGGDKQVVASGDFRVRLGIGGPSVLVHRAVLGARSEFFRSLFRSGSRMSETNEVVLQLEPVPTMPSFLQFLRFLYTGCTDLLTHPTHALDILSMTGAHDQDDDDNDNDDEAASAESGGGGGFFQIRNSGRLGSHCRKVLATGITVETVVPLLCRAHSVNNKAVKKSAMAFLLSNFRATADCPGFALLERYPGLTMEVLNALKEFDIRPQQVPPPPPPPLPSVQSPSPPRKVEGQQQDRAEEEIEGRSDAVTVDD